VAARSTSRRSETPIGELVAALTVEELREVVSAAVARHDDVQRQVRLVAARAAGDLAQLRAEVDRGLRTRRFLGYRESMEWARNDLACAVHTKRGQPLEVLALRRAQHERMYQRVADEVLERADRRAYAAAVRILKRARAAAQSAGALTEFTEYITHVRERYRRRPTLIAMMDKANLR